MFIRLARLTSLKDRPTLHQLEQPKWNMRKRILHPLRATITHTVSNIGTRSHVIKQTRNSSFKTNTTLPNNFVHINNVLYKRNNDFVNQWSTTILNQKIGNFAYLNSKHPMRSLLQRQIFIKYMSTTNEPQQEKDTNNHEKPQSTKTEEKVADQKSAKSKEHEAELLEALQKLKQQFNQLIEQQQKGPLIGDKHDTSTQLPKSHPSSTSTTENTQQPTTEQPPKQEIRATTTPSSSSATEQSKDEPKQPASEIPKEPRTEPTRARKPESPEKKRSMMMLRTTRVSLFDQLSNRYAFRGLGWNYNEFLQGGAAEEAFLTLFDLGKTNVDEIQRYCNEETFYRFKKLFSEAKDTSLFTIDPDFLSLNIVHIDEQPNNDTRIDVTVEYLHNPPPNKGKPLLATIKWTGKISENDEEVINPKFKATGLSLVW